MKWFKSAWPAAFALLAGVSCAQGQDIAVTVSINGGAANPIANSPFPSGSAITIPLGIVSQDTEVHIYDIGTAGNTAPTKSVGRVTITGTLGSTQAQLRINVLASGAGFPVYPNSVLAPGVVNFGLSAADGLVIQDEPLRRRSRLALAAKSEVTGDITVGHILRVQALDFNNSSAGLISANLTSVSTDDDAMPNVFDSSKAIGWITAGSGITGRIEARGNLVLRTPANSQDPNQNRFSGQAGIERVVVGPNPSTIGIQGDLLANDGSIGRIYCTGPIGPTPSGSSDPFPSDHPPAVSAPPVAIHAALGIAEIRAVRQDIYGTINPPDPAHPATFNVDVDPGVRGNSIVNGSNFDFEPNLGRIESAGDIYGSIHGFVCSEIEGVPQVTVFEQRPFGIYARGDLYADVHIDSNLRGAIVAKNIRGTIRIGYGLYGGIIAWNLADPDAPAIPLIEIGYGTGLPLAAGFHAVRGISGGNFLLGLGNLRVPNPASPTPVDHLYIDSGSSGNDDFLSSIILARKIGRLHIIQMTAYESDAVGYNGEQENYFERTAPIIEVQSIGRCASTRCARAWSGRATSTRPPTPTPTTTRTGRTTSRR